MEVGKPRFGLRGAAPHPFLLPTPRSPPCPAQRHVRSPRPRCVVALISQGINAQQTVANAVAATAFAETTQLQDLINDQAVVLLRRYHDHFRQVFASHTERP